MQNGNELSLYNLKGDVMDLFIFTFA